MSNKKIKVLYIATTADKRNRLDGETIKCRLLKDYLEKQHEIELKCVDTDNWQKHKFKLVYTIIKNYFWCDKIVISAADRGAHIVLKFFSMIKNKKEIYYFVVGGSLYKNILKNKWNIKCYEMIKEIYVEANILKENLNKIGLSNIRVVNNFRKVDNFEMGYKNSEINRFVYYGRVIKEKGIEEAIKLINKLNEDGYKSSLDIYGQIKPDYHEIVGRMLNSNIHFHGEIKPNNKIEYEILSQYDIFILPTEYPGECLPGALIDSYIAGLAVVVSDWPYAREYVEDNKNGVIFKYKDYEDMYIKTKQLIISNKIKEYKSMSKFISKKFLVDNILNDFGEEIKK